MKEDQIYWVGQKAFIEKDGEVLIFITPSGEPDFPGGKIQEGEDNLAESLKREVLEESNLEIEVGEPFAVWQRVFPENHKYAGKMIYLVAFKCSYVSGELKLSDEHKDFRWVNKDNYKEVDNGGEYFKTLDKYFKSL